MSCFDGPDIPTSGLICSLDPNSTKSWPGSGTSFKDATGNENSIAITGTGDFASYNGQTVLRVDGTTTVRTISNLSLGLPYTILSVDRYNGLGANYRGRTTTSASNNWLMNHWSNMRYPYYANGWVGTVYTTETTNNWEIGIVTGSAGDYHCYYDNIDKTSSPTAGTNGPLTVALGNMGAITAEPSNCDFGLIMIWNRVLSVTEITQLYIAIRTRFGQL